jgi:hypothetical protein
MCKIVVHFCLMSFTYTLKIILAINKINNTAVFTLLDGLLSSELRVGILGLRNNFIFRRLK